MHLVCSYIAHLQVLRLSLLEIIIMMKTFVILLAMLATFQARATSSQAPFQVSSCIFAEKISCQLLVKNLKASIQWKDLYGAQTEPFQFHICSGIIIHEKYILTPASCLLLPTLINTNFRSDRLGKIFILRPTFQSCLFVCKNKYKFDLLGGVWCWFN